MTHADVKMKFATLVVHLMSRIDLQRHSRMTSERERADVDEALRQLLKFKFSKLYYDSEDVLRFADEDDPLGRVERADRVARRAAYTASTGRYYTDAHLYSPDRAAGAPIGAPSGRGSKAPSSRKPGAPLESPWRERDRRLLEHLRK